MFYLVTDITGCYEVYRGGVKGIGVWDNVIPNGFS
jgi:hypothetical protein